MKKIVFIIFIFLFVTAFGQKDSTSLLDARAQAALYEQQSRLEALELSRMRIAFGSTVALILVAMLLAVSHLRRRRAESEQKALILEQRLLRSQMNPHFTFNMLSCIQNLILYEESEKAGICLADFSRLVRDILENSREDLIPVQKEIDFIATYLKLQSIRYAGKFDHELLVDPEIDPDNSWIPPMLAQPFIENAIEHGLRHKKTPGHIRVSFSREDDLVRFDVEDNGIGREEALEISAREGDTHQPLATSITAERLSLLNKKLRQNIGMQITDLKDASGMTTGTRVSFTIPIQSR